MIPNGTKVVVIELMPEEHKFENWNPHLCFDMPPRPRIGTMGVVAGHFTWPETYLSWYEVHFPWPYGQWNIPAEHLQRSKL